MFILSELVKSNYHIHTNLSTCASREMTVPRIISSARRAGLERIALVDHDHDDVENILGIIGSIKQEARNYDSGIEVLFGAELSAFGVGKYLVNKNISDQIDFRLYATNHYHHDFWDHPAKKTARDYAEHTLAILKELINSDRADCIAHPFVGIYLRDVLDDYTDVTKVITDRELGEIFDLAKKHHVSWELNTKSILIDPIFAKRFWSIGREVGADFKLGTDAHRLIDIEEPKVLELKVSSILGNV